MPVRREEDLLVGGNGPNDLLGVRGRHDDVRERLHGRRTVDVRQRDGARVLGAPPPEGLRRAGVLERASRLVVRKDDLSGGVQDLRRLRHEAHAGEGDDLRVALLGAAGEVERVADEVGQVLDGLFLVVVGEKDCIFLSLEIPDLGLEVQARIDRREVRRRGPRRKPRIGRHSRHRAHGRRSIARRRGKRFDPFTRNSRQWHKFCNPETREHRALQSDPRLDVKAVLFLVVTLGLAALELWGFVKLF